MKVEDMCQCNAMTVRGVQTKLLIVVTSDNARNEQSSKGIEDIRRLDIAAIIEVVQETGEAPLGDNVAFEQAGESAVSKCFRQAGFECLTGPFHQSCVIHAAISHLGLSLIRK